MENLFFTFWMIVCIIIAVIAIAGQWKTFEKANQPGWACIVPFYNLYVMLKIGGKPEWWLILFLIPGVNVIFIIWTYNMISKSFGKDEGFTLGLTFLGFIFWPILGFGDATYHGPYGKNQQRQTYQNQS